MKKNGILLFFLLLSICSDAAFIHRDGKLLRDKSNDPVLLRGVNLGGWLLWEGWIWGGKFTAQSAIQKNISAAAGEKNAADFRDYVYRNFIGEADIRAISEMGLNVVRVPFNNRIFDTAQCNAIGWQVLDSLLSWCAKYHVYAVLDMHGAPGGNSPYFTADPEKPDLWKSEKDKQRTVDLWKRIAARYKDNETVAGYDLLNEPIPASDADLTALYERIISAIRSVDKNHCLFVEGSSFAKKFTMFTSLPDENMCFSFHIYTWFGGKPADKMDDFVSLENRLNVPIWCGEWGENNYDVITQTRNALEEKQNGFSGWCFWTWKKIPNGYATLCAVEMDETWKPFITWCCKPSKKNTPSAQTANDELKKFEESMLFRNCRIDTNLRKILEVTR
ncbi:MAG TPA: cellulase family glycosylhydrolase [Bacteroidia bacterium]|nr:cellulase family glycosylhydrolase [Bacteroidia bacterium]